MILLVSLLVFGASLLQICEGYSSGAPAGACVHMIPGHLVAQNASNPISPQAVAAPYTVSISKNVYGPGEELRLTLSGTESFIGFFLQGRPDGEEVPVGGFSEPGAKMKTVPECSSDYAAAALTHTDQKPDATPWTTDGFTVKWTAPDTDVGNITFYATVAQTHSVFWVKVPSKSIAYSGFAVLHPTVYMLLLPLAIALLRSM